MDGQHVCLEVALGRLNEDDHGARDEQSFVVICLHTQIICRFARVRQEDQSFIVVVAYGTILPFVADS